MCMDHRMTCACGAAHASFHFRDDVMPAGVIDRLYCPSCSSAVAFDRRTMIADNGWIIGYDMEVARFMGHKLPAVTVSPELLFDEGYCTWRGIYPTDHTDSIREREELVKLAKINPRRYFEEFRKWSLSRMERLAAEGWRKALERQPVSPAMR